ncbi:MAG: diacylglycerol kinase family lipid kinase [Chloroflexi bacterium]|nr:diacylglycerol kinase family lipid kinase [Chloroflexota bacterium]
MNQEPADLAESSITVHSPTLSVVLLVNPAAGMRAAAVERVEAALRSRGAIVETVLTSRSGEGIEIARRAAGAGAGVVLVCGGDGTINEAVNGLAGTETALAVLPAGTVNVWAREVGIPLEPARALTLLWEGERRWIDLGQAGERYFLLMAGVGFDAYAAAQVTHQEKRRWGALAYVLRGLVTAMRWPRQRMWLRLDGRSLRRRALFLVVGNTRLYGGVVNITHQAVADDGQLDVCLFGGSGVVEKLAHAFRVVTRSHLGAPTVEYYRAGEVTLVTRPRVPVQVDGDTIGRTPMTFRAVPRALKVIVPRGQGRGLFLRPPEE